MSGPGYKRRRATTRLKPAANVGCNNNKKRKQKRKKKRSRGTGSGGNIGLSNSTSRFLDDSAIVCEMLSRLPVKSLVRFKCVCKLWRLLIEEDSYFIDLHLNQSKKRPKLFFIVPIPHENPRLWLQKQATLNRISYYKAELVTVDLMLEGRGRLALTTSVDSTRKMKFSSENIGFFGPINGVVGYGPTKSSTIRIYNISTREVSPWIKSELPRNSDDEEKIIERTPYYEMGFDPATKKHKVICIWRTSIYDFETSSFEYERVCEVLTVGDITWRRIELPPFELHNECYQRKHTIYLNGFIYFCTENLMKLGEQGNDKLVAFDVGAEKFRVITVPNFILNQPRHVYLSIYLIELEGRLAILSRMNDYTAKLWVFDDAYGNNKEMNSSTSNSSDQHWTEVTIELPYLWSDDREVSFHSVAGTELIVIESLEKQFIFTRHLYNWKTKSCKEIDINGRFKYYPLISTVSTLVESLLHVR